MNNALPFKTPTALDIDALARTIYGEARDQPLLGQIAVGYTIAHRAALGLTFARERGHDHPHYGDGSLMAACKSHAQYDCWMVSDKNYAVITAVTMNDANFQLAVYIAIGIVHRLVTDALPTATHYYNPSIVKQTPSWATPANDLHSAIGQHRFYRVWP